MEIEKWWELSGCATDGDWNYVQWIILGSRWRMHTSKEFQKPVKADCLMREKRKVAMRMEDIFLENKIENNLRLVAYMSSKYGEGRVQDTTSMEFVKYWYLV